MAHKHLWTQRLTCPTTHLTTQRKPRYSTPFPKRGMAIAEYEVPWSKIVPQKGGGEHPTSNKERRSARAVVYFCPALFLVYSVLFARSGGCSWRSWIVWVGFFFLVCDCVCLRVMRWGGGSMFRMGSLMRFPWLDCLDFILCRVLFGQMECLQDSISHSSQYLHGE